mgnify:CR=1 FL=1
MLPGAFSSVDHNCAGVINMYDMKPASRCTGTNSPYQFGLNIGVTHKDFDMNILFQRASGFVIGYANDDVFGYVSKTNPTL